MINVIFKMNVLPALTPEQMKSITVDFSVIPEMKDNCFQVNVSSVEEINYFKDMLQALGKEPVIIGAWQPNGLQLGYGFDDEGIVIQEGVVYFPFDFSLYAECLNDLSIGGADPRRPTEIEARNIQVNSFVGNISRYIAAYKDPNEQG